MLSGFHRFLEDLILSIAVDDEGVRSVEGFMIGNRFSCFLVVWEIPAGYGGLKRVKSDIPELNVGVYLRTFMIFSLYLAGVCRSPSIFCYISDLFNFYGITSSVKVLISGL